LEDDYNSLWEYPEAYSVGRRLDRFGLNFSKLIARIHSGLSKRLYLIQGLPFEGVPALELDSESDSERLSSRPRIEPESKPDSKPDPEPDDFEKGIFRTLEEYVAGLGDTLEKRRALGLVLPTTVPDSESDAEPDNDDESKSDIGHDSEPKGAPASDESDSDHDCGKHGEQENEPGGEHDRGKHDTDPSSMKERNLMYYLKEQDPDFKDLKGGRYPAREDGKKKIPNLSPPLVDTPGSMAPKKTRYMAPPYSAADVELAWKAALEEDSVTSEKPAGTVEIQYDVYVVYVVSHKEDGTARPGSGVHAQNYPIVEPTPFDEAMAKDVSDYLGNIYDIDEKAWDLICRRQLPPNFVYQDWFVEPFEGTFAWKVYLHAPHIYLWMMSAR
jgi:hypothetical protein